MVTAINYHAFGCMFVVTMVTKLKFSLNLGLTSLMELGLENLKMVC
jgi:hypothetical protein